MKRELIIATLAALGVAACSPDLSADGQPAPSVAAAPAQPVGADKSGGGGAPVVQAAAESDNQDGDKRAADDGKEADQKDDGEKKPQ